MRGTIPEKPEVYGVSERGTPLEVWLPGKEGNPKTLVIAGIHGDEPETTVLLSEALRLILPEDLRAAVVLCANPDGMVRGTRGSSQDVDLNRNFPTQDWQTGVTLSRWKVDEPREVKLYTGDYAQSEPETEAMTTLIKRLAPDDIVSLHSPLACVEDMQGSNLGVWLADRSGLPLVADIGYPTPGSLGTWAREQNIRLVTYELPHGASLEPVRHTHSAVLADLIRGLTDPS